MNKIRNGLLVAVEGIDGSGKSTLCSTLASQLQNQYTVVLTKEPGGTSLGKQIRTLLLDKQVAIDSKAEFLLFAADRAQHFKEVVLPALEQEGIVISDRMADSSRVYQGYGRNIDVTTIDSINQFAMAGRQPDLVLYLKLDPSVAYERIRSRNNPLTSFEKEAALIQKLNEGFDRLVASRPTTVTLDASLAQEVVVKQAMAAITKLLDKQ